MEPVSIISLLVATVALYFSLKPDKSPPTATAKAFKVLEADVEDLMGRVESHLGRISRLKRGTAPPVLPSSQTAAPVETKHLSRAMLYAHARRRHADTHGDGARTERTK